MGCVRSWSWPEWRVVDQRHLQLMTQRHKLAREREPTGAARVVGIDPRTPVVGMRGDGCRDGCGRRWRVGVSRRQTRRPAVCERRVGMVREGALRASPPAPGLPLQRPVVMSWGCTGNGGSAQKGSQGSRPRKTGETVASGGKGASIWASGRVPRRVGRVPFWEVGPISHRRQRWGGGAAQRDASPLPDSPL